MQIEIEFISLVDAFEKLRKLEGGLGLNEEVVPARKKAMCHHHFLFFAYSR